MAIALNFLTQEVEGLYYRYSENKSADQLCGYRTADMRIFAYAKGQFSHYAAHSNQNLSEPGDWRFFYLNVMLTFPAGHRRHRKRHQFMASYE